MISCVGGDSLWILNNHESDVTETNFAIIFLCNKINHLSAILVLVKCFDKISTDEETLPMVTIPLSG